LKFPTAAIIGTVQRFGAGPRDNPGRLEQWRHRGAIVLIDYAHNPDALAKLLRVARALRPRQLALLLGQAGNRDDAAIADLAATAARFAPDRVILKELPLMLRGRAQGEVPVLLERALTAAGMAANRIMHEPDEESAARRLLDTAEAGDVIVLPIHTRAVRERLRQILT
jgi:UDP-N-acetylmuramyl tripeptide synthase